MFPTLMYRVLSSAFLFLVCLGFFAASSYGQTAIAVSWTDGTGNWSVPTNWNPAVVPKPTGLLVLSACLAAFVYTFLRKRVVT